ncbi:MAG: hypothetical protein ACOCUH_03995 [Bacteriovoracia bacterium]
MRILVVALFVSVFSANLWAQAGAPSSANNNGEIGAYQHYIRGVGQVDNDCKVIVGGDLQADPRGEDHCTTSELKAQTQFALDKAIEVVGNVEDGFNVDCSLKKVTRVKAKATCNGSLSKVVVRFDPDCDTGENSLRKIIVK